MAAYSKLSVNTSDNHQEKTESAHKQGAMTAVNFFWILNGFRHHRKISNYSKCITIGIIILSLDLFNKIK